jgi:hypothetical protein
MEESAYGNHPLWEAINNFEAALTQAEEQGESESDAGPPLDRLRYLLATIKSHQGPTDTAPYANATLTATQNALTNVQSELQNYASNGNIGHLTNADSYGDAVLQTLGTWPSSSLKGGAAVQASKVFQEYRTAAEAALATVRDANDALQTKLTSQKEEAGRAIESLKADVAELSTKISQDETRLDTALTTNNEAFTTAQSARDDSFKEWLETKGEGFKEGAQPHLEALEKLQTDAQQVYDKIDSLRDGTEKVAGLASADLLAGKFQTYAKEQWDAGIKAVVTGFLALAAGLCFVIWTLHSIGTNDAVSWQYTALKLGATLTIVGAAAVAFRLGSQFLSRSAKSKRLELELRAIGPFFADVDDAEALKEAKKDFVARSFGKGWDTNETDGELSKGQMATLIQQLGDLARTLANRQQP